MIPPSCSGLFQSDSHVRACACVCVYLLSSNVTLQSSWLLLSLLPFWGEYLTHLVCELWWKGAVCSGQEFGCVCLHLHLLELRCCWWGWGDLVVCQFLRGSLFFSMSSVCLAGMRWSYLTVDEKDYVILLEIAFSFHLSWWQRRERERGGGG